MEIWLFNRRGTYDGARFATDTILYVNSNDPPSHVRVHDVRCFELGVTRIIRLTRKASG